MKFLIFNFCRNLSDEKDGASSTISSLTAHTSNAIDSLSLAAAGASIASTSTAETNPDLKSNLDCIENSTDKDKEVCIIISNTLIHLFKSLFNF